ncbi:UFD1 Ubiquitin fusion degradation protein 1 [Candida maltosa Xu316]|uniref:Ubiquitin fusion degradation protein 1 n=1 Tax=Candida maltosa (strain Xu316) TaxID=1245528 RepID=M3K6K1_CANMX|nr:Ubiquitin fusion degradation protein, putative [Candida maltosa Xu316]
MFSSFGSSMFGSGFGSPSPMNNKFEEYFRCYPISMMPELIRKDDANYGGKIFLPPSALNKLTMLHIRYPMLFEIKNEQNGKLSHSGVLEFIAEEGRTYLPQWMMTTLNLSPGSLIKVTNCDLSLGKFVKIEPQSVDFLDISDPKAVLENVLRKFSTLTVNDIIEVNYNDTIYGIKVLEVKPNDTSHGICVVETDLETDFAPPVGYVEPEYKPKTVKPTSTPIDPSKVNRGAGAATMAKSINYAKLVADGGKVEKFTGGGQKLSGKTVDKEDDSKKNYNIDDLDPNAPPVPLNLPENQLFFGFPVVLPTQEEVDEAAKEELKKKEAFSGAGQSLRQSKKRKDKNPNHAPLKNHSRSPDVIEID